MKTPAICKSRLFDLSVVAGIICSVSVTDVVGTIVGEGLFEGKDDLKHLQVSTGVGALAISASSLALAVVAQRRMRTLTALGPSFCAAVALSAFISSVAAVVLIISLAVFSVVTAASGNVVLLSFTVFSTVILVLLVGALGECACKALIMRRSLDSQADSHFDGQGDASHLEIKPGDRKLSEGGGLDF
jgi:hypothetical protein